MNGRFGRLVVFLCIMPLLFICRSAGNAEVIQNDEQGEAVFKVARTFMARLGVAVDREILLKVRPYDEVQVQHCSTGGRAISVGGYYQPYDPETIWIVSGQSRNRTMADMAHELAHAWQSTNAPSQDRKLKEGFAMWCEYHVLLMVGETAEASSLLKIDDPDYGDGLRLFLDLERKSGAPAVVEYERTATQPPGK